MILPVSDEWEIECYLFSFSPLFMYSKTTIPALMILKMRETIMS